MRGGGQEPACSVLSACIRLQACLRASRLFPTSQQTQPGVCSCDVSSSVHAQLHGGNIQPFDFADRAALLHGLDDSIAAIRLENIELLAVEEILPASGPSSESLTSLLNDGSSAGMSPKGGPAAPLPLPPALPPATTRALAPANSAHQRPLPVHW